MRRSSDSMRPAGSTLLEVTIVLVVLGVIVALALPDLRRAGDAASVRSAVTSTVATLVAARHTAIARGATSTVRVDTARGRILVLVASETTLVRDLRNAHGVRLGATRLELRYTPNGLGYGASNTRLTIGRGRSADTVIVSRLGRVRH